MNCTFLIPCDDSQDRKINRQTIYTLVKCLLLQQQLVYHQASIVDEMSHTLDDPNGLIFLPINDMLNNNSFISFGTFVKSVYQSVRQH